MENTTELIEALTTVQGGIGDDSQTETITALLIDILAFVQGIDEMVEALQNDVNALNEKNRGLVSSNNLLYRQMAQKDDAVKEATEKLSEVAQMSELIP